MSEEEQIKKILDKAYLSGDSNWRIKSVDTVANYGKIAIDHLLDFNERIMDDEIRRYVMTKIQEIKTKNP